MKLFLLNLLIFGPSVANSTATGQANQREHAAPPGTGGRPQPTPAPEPDTSGSFTDNAERGFPQGNTSSLPGTDGENRTNYFYPTSVCFIPP